MAIPKHKYNLNERNLAKIEHLLPRLKYSIFPSKIIKWLENFEQEDQKLAFDLLLVLEYITFNELQFRFDDLLKEIFKNIPSNENIIIIPYGKVGKSGSIITYLIKNTAAFRTRKKKDEDNILLTHDYKYIKATNYDHIIFIDDFIGSGKTFCDEYKDVHDVESWVFKNKISNVYLLSSVIMSEAKVKIESRFNYITIKSEERNKIFHPANSPLQAFKNLPAIKEMAYKYGKSIKENPYGFESTESFISFFHGTPNNTLPVIWSAKNDWNPLFPRKADVKMDIARKEKKEIAFMIGIYNRLGIDLYDKNESIYIETYTGRRREIKYNSHEHFATIGLIKLKKEGHDDIFICHLLGVTIHELNHIYKKAIELKFISQSKNITFDGLNFIKEINKVVSSEAAINRTDSTNNLTKKLNELYLPETFKGLT